MYTFIMFDKSRNRVDFTVAATSLDELAHKLVERYCWDERLLSYADSLSEESIKAGESNFALDDVFVASTIYIDSGDMHEN